MIKKIVFVEPKSTHLHVYSRVTIPRLGSVLLGTILRNRGHEVKVYIEDIAAIDMDQVMSADLVCISAITSTAPQSYRLTDRVREAGIPVVLGGTHTSFLPDEGLDHATYVVRGEGESAIVELIEAIQQGRGFDKILGLSYWHEGEKHHNPERPKIPNLDVNPIPDFTLIKGWKEGGIVSIATSRGCPFSCTFCSVPGMYGHAFRTHSIDRVLEELKLHRDADYIFFADDIFTANKKRTKELLSRMIAEGITPLWGAQVRTETVDDAEMLKLMRDSNCFNVYVGFESINPKTLKLFEKKQDLAKIERSIEKFHEHKIKIHGMFVVGSDEDDLETVAATAEFARAREIESVQFMILTPIPGSPDWDHIYSKGNREIISNDWTLYDGHHVVHQPRKISPYELQIATMKAMARFYSWSGILTRLAKLDLFTAVIRLYGKRLIKSWYKDNKGYVASLKQGLFGEAMETKASRWRKVRGTVGIPEVFLQDRIGSLLNSFLSELGVTVVPVPEEGLLQRLRTSVDCLIVPIINKAMQGKEEFYRQLNAINASIQENLEKLPRVVHFPVNHIQGPMFESFARIGLTFTSRLGTIRAAYLKAGESQGLWERA